MKTESAVVRAYRTLLRLYPRSFRDEYGDDMLAVLRAQLRDEAMPRVLGRAAVDLAVTIPTRHLETRMQHPSKLAVTVPYLVVVAVGVLLAVVGGGPLVALTSIAIAVGAGALAVTAWHRSTTPSQHTIMSRWWLYLLAGPALVGIVIAGAHLGVDAWFVGMMLVLVGFMSTTLGVLLGIAYATTGRR